MKVISGGQTGADRGGLDAAIELGIEHGGWCPRGRKAEDGKIPDCYHLRETVASNYQVRTLRNVEDSDVTLIFIKGDKVTGGSLLTKHYCEISSVKYAVIDVFGPFPPLFDRLVPFLREIIGSTINVAGNRESKSPGIHDHVQALLRVVFKEV